MPNVRLIDAPNAPLLAKPYYAEGDPGPLVGALAQVPELLEVTMPFIGAALGPSAISWREKELVIVRTSALLECQYCIGTHTAVALDAGLTTDEVHALRGALDIDAVYTVPRELSLLHWVDAVATGRGQVAEELQTRLRQHWEDHEIVELTVLVGATMMLNRMSTALGLPIEAATAERIAREGFE